MAPKKTKPVPCFAGGKQGSVLAKFDDGLEPASVEVAYVLQNSGLGGHFAYMTSGDELHVKRSGIMVHTGINSTDPEAVLAFICKIIARGISRAGHRTLVETLLSAATFDWEPYTRITKNQPPVQRGSTYGDVDLDQEQFLTLLTRMDLRKERRMQRKAERLNATKLLGDGSRSQEAKMPVNTSLASSADAGGVNPFLVMHASHVERLAAAALPPASRVAGEAEAAKKAKLEREQARASWKGRLLNTSAGLLRKLTSFLRPGEDTTIVDELMDHYSAPDFTSLLSGRTRRALATKVISVAEDARELAKLSASANEEFYYAFLLRDSSEQNKRLAVFRPD